MKALLLIGFFGALTYAIARGFKRMEQENEEPNDENDNYFL